MAIEDISAILDPHVRDRSLGRIGYFEHTEKRGRQVNYRKLLDWFVKFSQKNLATMSQEELQLRRDDMRALQEERFTFTEDNASTAKHMPSTHATVAQYVEQLTKTGNIVFEEFALRPSILSPRFSPRPTTSFKHNIYIGEHVEPFHGKGLLYLFFEALKGAGDRLRLCAHCGTVFVQTRRKQRFCSSRDRQAALRARRRREREAKKTKRQRDAQPKRVTRTHKKWGVAWRKKA